VACKAFSLGRAKAELTYATLAESLRLSTSTAHEAVERLRLAEVVAASGFHVASKGLRDLLVVAVPRVFYAVRGSLVRGMPTSTAAPILAGKFATVASAGAARPVVWCEDAEDVPGFLLGEGIEPLYPTAPTAAREDALLYELLALADVMRVGGARERTVAAALVDERLFKR
jgi:DNA-binding Lrp family transcriptional regulator